MKIDPTTTVGDNNPEFLDLEQVDITAVVEEYDYSAVLTPTTVSISSLFLDSGASEPEDPIDPNEPLYWGLPSKHLGLGGCTCYSECYPIGGI